jgi:hypothetical protein
MDFPDRLCLHGLLQLRNKGLEGSGRKTFKNETRSTIFRPKERNPPNFETGVSSCKVVKTNAFTDFVDMTRALIKLARANGLSEDVEELLEKKAKAISRVGEYRLTTYRETS